MFKPHVALTAAGAVIAAAGAACGFLVPVGPGCPSAFSLENVFLPGVGSVDSTTFMTTCRPAAAQASPLWAVVILAGIALTVAGLVWSLTVWTRPAARHHESSPSEAPRRTRGGDLHRPAPFWPLVVGLAVIGVGVFLGFTVSVGTNCNGAFAPQTSASGADIANAMVSGRRTNYSGICEAAAGQQSVIYWGIIGFGAAVVILGAVLRSLQGRKTMELPRESVAGELSQLAQLLERGVLSRDEFDREKNRLLSQG